MKVFGVALQEGSSITNLTVASGTSFPADPNEGELFYRSDVSASVKGLYLYIGGAWDRISVSEIAETQIVDGALLARVGAAETISGSWTFSAAVTGAEPSTSGHLTTKNYVDTQVSSSSSGLTMVVVSGTSQTAVSGSMYVCTATGSTTTVTLPAAPSLGNTVAIANFTSRTDLIVERNSLKIMGLAENMTLNRDQTTVTLRYVNSTIGWIIV